MEYEQARGLRAAGARRDGTFVATASKTVAAPVARLFAAFAEEGLRERWLPDAQLAERLSKPPRSIRFEQSDGTRVAATFAEQTAGKAQVAVEHARLPDEQSAAAVKRLWRDRLSALKALLEEQ